MSRWNRVERALEAWAFPHLTLLLIAGQLLVYLLEAAHLPAIRAIELVPARVLDGGEVWRLVTFLMTPPQCNPFFAFFGWYLFFIMGNALNAHWGALRYNLFILLGWLLTAGMAFAVPHQSAPNLFIGGSVFLAFAWMYPDFEIYILFILPLKIKWLALLTWVLYGWTLLFGTMLERLMILASMGNVLMFFGRDMFWAIRRGQRRVGVKVRSTVAEKEDPKHCCVVCGRTLQSHPEMEFRYCRTCVPTACYCREHLNPHVHRSMAPAKKNPKMPPRDGGSG